MDFQKCLADYRNTVNAYLETCFAEPDGFAAGKLTEAMRYSLQAGGKRIRPILVLAFSRLCGGDTEKVLPVACAVEMLHTYTLIHDDLPCMDNDDLRRGKPTCHKVYGVCTATLAGDALQAAAFETVLRAELPPERLCACALTLAENAGAFGICAGQQMDMEWEGRKLSSDELAEVNDKKTSRLLVAACRMGVLAAGGTDAELLAAERYAKALGDAFQLRDDVLDVIGEESVLGKPIGSDREEHKNTYVTLLGLDRCREEIAKKTQEAKAALASFGDAEFLLALADSMAERMN